MKAASSFVRTVCAVALSFGLVFTGAVAVELASTPAAHAAVVSSITVRGNQRVDAATVRNYVGIRPGKSFSDNDVNEALKRLFATGLFANVRIYRSGSTLVIEVEEHQIVNQVLFQGNKKIKDEQLRNAVQMKPRGAFSQSLLEADVQAVRDAYAHIGREDAVVTTDVQDLGDGRVNVIFNITEGGRTKIAAINFVGNNAYSDRRLADVIQTKRSNILSFLSRADVYDEDKLRADEELLRRFYYTHGYADFRVISSYADLDAAENKYTVTFTVDEGEKYTFGKIDVLNTLDGVDTASLSSLIETREGDVYNAKDVEDTIIAMTESLAGRGYAFAQVTPRGDRDFANRTISVTYSVDEGPRAYVERIEIRGNNRTRDYVIRREFDISEGDAFNQILIQRAKRRLDDLDFFQTVNISTAPGSAADQVVLVVDVVEKSTGELSIGAGYTTSATSASAKGFSLEGSISERNFLGRGQSIRLAVGGSTNSRDYTLSFTEPYFLGRRISAGFDLVRQTRGYTNYNTTSTGATVRFGLPITTALSTQFAYNYVKDSYTYTSGCDSNGDGIADAGCSISGALSNAIQNQSPWTKSSVSGTLIFNTIDNMNNPRDGIYALFSTEVAGLGGNSRFIKLSGRGSYYHTLSEQADIVGLVAVGGGHVSSFGGTTLRVFDYFQNDSRMIRGFEYNGIGPVDTTTGDHLGGSTYFSATAEAQFPIPAVPPSLGLRGAVFVDAATLYGNALAQANGSLASSIRASVGASLIWASPFGPLRVDYAVPIKKLSTDTVQNFNFGISTRF